MVQTDSDNNRVLVVDDQNEIHDDFAEMLKPGREKAGTDELATAFLTEEDRSFLPDFELMHAGGGEEACKIVEAARDSNLPIAAAYIDIRMPPGIDGIETIRRIRKIDRDIEIVIMTAYTDKSLPEIIHDMELLHKVLYIRKPFAREEIQQITLSLVGKWNVEKALAGEREKLARSNRRLEAVLNATGDAMAMYDGGGRLVFANEGYEKLLDLSEGKLKEISAEDLEERFRERFQPPSLPDLEGKFLIGESEEPAAGAATDQLPRQRLFYRSSAPVRGGAAEVMGRLDVYRDVSREIEVERMKAEVLRLRNELEKTYSFAGMVGNSESMQKVYSLMNQAAESDIAVLISGESGTGKELVARSFHYGSRRKGGPFVAVNCAALPEGLMESELFGHERGAFTGAVEQRIGAFERAGGGTIFLDEVGDMQPALQAKLLRVLQEKEVQRLGGTGTRPIDVRVIAATNKDLEGAIREGVFREDLFYRLAAFPIAIPPLRERREDIPLLANHFLDKHAGASDKRLGGLSTAALRVLLQYDWPGNVRELENVIERAVLLETTEVLQAGNLPSQLFPTGAGQEDRRAPPAILPLEEVERQAMVQALELSDNNASAAARALGVNRATLYRKLKKYDLLSDD